MKIALTTPLEEPIPPARYGGTELIVHLLAEGYVKSGHEVYLLGTGDSQTDAHLVPIVERSIRTMPVSMQTATMRDYWKYTGTARIVEQINRLKPDIVHNHFAWRLIAFEHLIHSPMMSTMHGPLSDLKEIETYSAHHHHRYISISDNQRMALPDLNWLATVHHGIEIDKYPVNRSPSGRDYFAFLGRTSPEKGLAELVKMIRHTGHRLKIAAKIDKVDNDYYRRQVEPYVDGDQIEYVGELGHQEKCDFLMKAKALLLWLNWEEPFGLVIPEAGACGTPVIARSMGAMPELIKDGVTGFLVNSLEEMLARLAMISSLDPSRCRTHIEENFSSTRMVGDYLKIAENVAINSTGSLSPNR